MSSPKICRINSCLTSDLASLSLFVGPSSQTITPNRRRQPSFLHHSQNPESHFLLGDANSHSQASYVLEILLVSELMSERDANYSTE